MGAAASTILCLVCSPFVTVVWMDAGTIRSQKNIPIFFATEWSLLRSKGADKRKDRAMIFKGVTLLLASGLAFGQSPLGYSVVTPRPISPAQGTTTPSAHATQSQNPYLGSVPSKPT